MKRQIAFLLFPCAFALGADAQPAQPPLRLISVSAPAAEALPFAMTGNETAANEEEHLVSSTVPTAVGRAVKPVLPMGNLRLEGEHAAHAWTVFLTSDEAGAADGLQLTYVNSVSVMPEVSRLRLLINGTEAITTPIVSQGLSKSMHIPVAPGLLRPGANTVRIEARQRHRVACAVADTYELWTDIDAGLTGLTFAGDETGGGRPMRMESLDDIAAIGFDSTGTTTLTMVLPGGELHPRIAARLLYLAQALALRGGFPHPVVALADRMPEGSRAGELVVVISPPPATTDDAGPAATTGNGAVHFPDLHDGSQALAITGRTLGDIDRGIGMIASLPPDRQGGGWPTADRSALHHPAPPLIEGRRSLTFSELGIDNLEFSGRRMEVSLAIALPADFYARNYAEARFLIDAGFGIDLLRESQFVVSVNGQTSSVLPLEAEAGQLFRNMPIRVPMRHFRPGLNIIKLTGLFRTDQDNDCLPGTTLSGDPRFVLFDTSTLVIPDFGRIGTAPDLAAFSAGGFGPVDGDDMLSLYLADDKRGTIAATATLLANIAVAARHARPVDIVADIRQIEQRNALLVGASDEMPPQVFAQAGLARSLQLSPAASSADAPASAGRRTLRPDAETIRESWEHRKVTEDLTPQSGRTLELSFGTTFDLSFDSLLPNLRNTPYTPPRHTMLVLAQGESPRGHGVWTVMTARSADALELAAIELTRSPTWSRVDGRITALRRGGDAVQVVMPEWTAFIPTQPLDLHNVHGVASNWASGNPSIYALGMLAVTLLLGFSTYAILIQLGRR